MPVSERLLTRLLTGETLSGETLSREMGVTRAAVWKQIERLRGMGFVIESEGRSGYHLVSCPDSLMEPVVRQGLDTAWAGCRVEWFPVIDSTNRYAKQLAAEGAPHGTVVLADQQTAGRGRRGRGWLTPAGEGVALSLILRPDTHPSQVAVVSLEIAMAGAAAAEAVTGEKAGIKWPNDVILKGKKVEGILVEMDADEQTVHFLVAGIGFNVHQKEFPPEIAQTASSMDLIAGHEVSRAALVRAFLKGIEEAEVLRATGRLLEAYRRRSVTIGQKVRVIGTTEAFTGEALDITQSGSLLVRDPEGKVREVLAGDVSVRGLMGYV